MEKVSEALKALQAIQRQAEEMNQNALKDYEQNLQNSLKSVESTFTNDIAQINQEALRQLAETTQTSTQRQKEKYEQMEALLDKHLKEMATKLQQQSQQNKALMKSSWQVSLGVLALSVLGGSMFIAWSLTTSNRQVEELQYQNSSLQKQVSELKKQIGHKAPKRN